MNQRDMDALYDAIIAYSGEAHRDFLPELIGKWKFRLDDEVQYADERAWIKDIFKPEVTYRTEERDKYPRFAPRKIAPTRNEELQAGDTDALDSFLAEFGNANK